ncbi:hypothetical protein C7H19_05960 [Aphanothece hegewaldii CCALA 016]|uniref:Glycosyltransferase family 1 protein n=1 Tax=Aphanothece hegewaldii CCALA 016 TaxID=2107694 RepID=A0A2T1M1H6_9CHRO|nr:glycosyltransferase family 1 protein [Aphanothece hegewaldii]PSF38527.1 hypothetical protein C7H19_05960 [Aphanothece hegewaldii CCALA 016]
MTKIYFYTPHKIQQQIIQENHTQWRSHHSNFMAWIAQTYFYLKQAGFPCKITEKIPDEGILIADRDTLANNYPFLDQVMLICAKSDKEYHPSAHLHTIHNPIDWQKEKNTIWNPHLINHWPIPGLIPRDKKRLSNVENIAYIGSKSQIAPELISTTWKDALSSLNCHWLPIFNSSQWNDYTCLDVIVAARSFESNIYLNKGAIKLINAWHAGVPAILTPESGFMAERKTDLDFIIVRSVDEAIQAVKKLKNYPELYHKMVENGYERAKETSIQQTLNKWVSFFNDVAFPAYAEWSKMSKNQKRFLFYQRYFNFKYSRVKDRFTRKIKLI